MNCVHTALLIIILTISACSETTESPDTEPFPCCSTNPVPADGSISVAVEDSIGWTYNHDIDFSLPAGFRVLVSETDDLSDAFESFAEYSGAG